MNTLWIIETSKVELLFISYIALCGRCIYRGLTSQQIIFKSIHLLFSDSLVCYVIKLSPKPYCFLLLTLFTHCLKTDYKMPCNQYLELLFYPAMRRDNETCHIKPYFHDCHILSTHIFAVLNVRLAAEVFCIQVFKIRLANRDGNTHGEVGVVNEGHVVLINHILPHTAPNAAGCTVAIFGIVQFAVDVNRVICNTVELLLIHFIQRFLLLFCRLFVRIRINRNNARLQDCS